MIRRPRLRPEEKEQIKHLYGVGATFNSIADQLERSPHTIKNYLIQPDVAQEVKEIKKSLADKFESIAERMLDSVVETDIVKLNAYQRVMSSAVAVDKCRLLREQTTENIGIIASLMQVADRIKEIEAAEEKAKLLPAVVDPNDE